MGLVEVDGLGDVEVKLFSGRNADVEAVALDRVEDLLRVLVEHGARACERGILRRAERRLGGLAGQRIGGVVVSSKPVVAALKEGGGEEFDLGPIIRFENVALQSGRAVRELPSAGRLIALHVERDAMQGQLGPVHPVGRAPDQNPVVVAGDAFAGRINLGFAVDLRSCGNDELSVMPDVLGDKTDDGRFDLGRINGDDRFARNHSSIRRVGIGHLRFLVVAVVKRDRQRGWAGRNFGRASWSSVGGAGCLLAKSGVGLVGKPSGRFLELARDLSKVRRA